MPTRPALLVGNARVPISPGSSVTPQIGSAVAPG
jgi:hypothetical protein